MKLVILFSTFSFLFAFQVMAQSQTPSIGMHHLTPKPAAPQPKVQPETPIEEAGKEKITLPEYTPLTPKESLVELDDLEKWDHLDEAATAHSTSDLKKLVYIIESDRGAVPPQGLFLAAKALSDNKQMEQAALYYFVGQLRLNFDVTRWPPRINKEDAERLAQDNKKTEDQSAPNRDRSPRIDNPHGGVNNLSNSIGQPIIAWAIKDPERFSKIINQVREWDASAPYSYDPGYAAGEAVPFEKWPKILTKVRENYFKRMGNLTKIMAYSKK